MEEMTTLRNVIATVGILLFGLISPSTAFAQTNIRHSEVSTLESNEVIDDDYFAAGEKVVVLGIVHGDAYIAAGNVRIEGVVDGDLLIAGGNVEIPGDIAGDVRVVGGDVTVSGTVGGNLTIISGSGKVESGAQLGGNVVSVGGDQEFDAAIPGSLTAAAGNLTVANAIGKGITAAVGQLNLTPRADIGGDVTYLSQEEADIAKEATISGKLTHNLPPEVQNPQVNKRAVFAVAAGLSIWSLVSQLLVGLLMVNLLPRFIGRAAEIITKTPLVAVGTGLLILIVLPIVAVILMITVIGLPLGLFALAGYAAMLYVSGIFVSLVLGEKLLGYVAKGQKPWLAFVVGLVALHIIFLVPIIGGLAKLATVLFGIGGSSLAKMNMYKEFRSKKLL